MRAEKLALILKSRKLLTFLILFISISYVGIVSAVEVCKFTYKGSPDDLNDTTVIVPDEMVALSEYIYVDLKTIVDSIPDTPTIFFIIDHSSSMSWEGGINDSAGNRFRVTSAFIDTLYKYFPAAEVGVSVFQRYLYYKPGDNPLFTQCASPQDTLGAYIPLRILNKDYSGQLGKDVIKAMLETEPRMSPDTVNPRAFIDLKYQPSTAWPDWQSPGTHINAGFIAAKHAISTSAYDPQNHYIIFLSDGEANWPSIGANEFVQGTDVPTTFTVFFTSNGTTPQSIVNMTTNIRQNNYSISNPKSNYWAYYNTTFEQLMKFLMDNVFTVISQGSTARPKQITISGTSVTNWDSTGFTFSNLFPLTGRTTTFNADIVYSIYDAGGNYTGTDTTHLIKDFRVQIDPGAGNLPDTFDVLCWDRNLNFRYNNQNISAANETMLQLGLRFDNKPQQANYNYTNAKVEVTHAQGGSKDKETFTLTGSSNDFSIQFSRVIDSTPTPGNQILEHHAFDTLIATFRNSESPRLPLDTLRVAIPFILGAPVTVYQAEYYDLKHGSAKGADGLIDKIKLHVSNSVTQAQITELNNNKDLVVLPSFRNFTKNSFSLDGGDIAIDVTEGRTVPITNVTNDDNLEVKFTIFSSGGYLTAATMQIVDKVAPVINSAALIDYQDPSKTDSLTIIFSEPVKSVQTPKPFELYGTAGSVNSYFCDVSLLGLSSDTGRFSVDGNFTGGVQGIAAGDSIRIEESNNVVDNANNNQDANNNVRREIDVELKLNPYIIDLIAINPFSINDLNPNNIIDPDIINNINNIDPNIIPNIFQIDPINGNYYGMIIQIVPDSIQNLDPKFKMEGELSIYDAVGNQIVDGKKMAEYKKTLIFIWNGRNTKNREVGIGTYLAVASITTYPLGKGDGKPTEKLIKKRLLGVQD